MPEVKKDGPVILVRCAGRRAVRFRQGQRLRIGRHRSNDIVLNDSTVSRFHATLVWDSDEDRPYLEDNGSANGTEVDGLVIEGRAYLSGDNQLTIGEFPMALELRGTRPVRRDGSSESLSDSALIDTPTQVRLFTEGGGDVEGKFADLKQLQRVLVMFEDDERTGTLTLRIGARTWRVTYSQGKIVTAQRGEVHGFEAIHEFLMRDQAGTFHFGLDLEPCEENLNVSARFLLSAGGSATMIHRKKQL